MMTWTRVTDPDTAMTLLPGWFGARMLAIRGSYGFLLASGDVVRVSRVAAVHLSSAGSILVDVLLDRAGVPQGVDPAWRSRNYLGAPVPGATLATLNLDQVVLAVEFVEAEIADTIHEAEMTTALGTDADLVMSQDNAAGRRLGAP